MHVVKMSELEKEPKLAAQVAAEQAAALGASVGIVYGAAATVGGRPVVRFAGFGAANAFILSFSFFALYDVAKKKTELPHVTACASAAAITGFSYGSLFGGLRTGLRGFIAFPVLAVSGFYAHDYAEDWRRAKAAQVAKERLLAEEKSKEK